MKQIIYLDRLKGLPLSQNTAGMQQGLRSNYMFVLVDRIDPFDPSDPFDTFDRVQLNGCGHNEPAFYPSRPK